MNNQLPVSWRHCLTLISNLGICDREARLDVCEDILGFRPTSMNNLTDRDINYMIDVLTAWKNIQDTRFATGALVFEHKLINDMIENDTLPWTVPVSSTYSTLPRTERRDMAKKAAENTTASYDDILTMIKNSTGVSLAPKSIQESTVGDDGRYTFGRLPREECYKSSVPSLGVALETGGIPIDSVIHLWGEKGCGKTTFCLNEIAAQQRQGRQCIYVNAEAGYQPRYAQALGVNIKDLVVVNVDNLEAASDLLRNVATSGALVVIDSIAALQSKADIEREYSTTPARMAGSSALWTNAINRFRTKARGTTLILINQVRAKFDAGPYGNPNKPYGANSIQHAADISLSFTKTKSVGKSAMDELGMQGLNIRFDKNRWSDTKDKKLTVAYHPGFPFSKAYDLLTLAETPIAYSRVSRGMASDSIYCNMSRDADTGDIAPKMNNFLFSLDAELGEAARKDEPELSPDDRYVSTRFFKTALKWLQSHPRYMDAAEERLLDTVDRDCEENHKNRTMFL